MPTLLDNDVRGLPLSHIKGTGQFSPLCRQQRRLNLLTELRYIPADLGQGQTDESRTKNGITEEMRLKLIRLI